MDALALNHRAWSVAQQLAQHAAALGASVHEVAGATVIDAGVMSVGSLEAGLLLARACLADLGSVSLTPVKVKDLTVPGVTVSVAHPVAACMASQYAGWQITAEQYFAMGSGPMRAAYGKEPLFDEIGLREPNPPHVVGVLETGRLPTIEAINYIATRCRVEPAQLTLLCARTASLAGGVQVVARSVETALHKLHSLHFDLKRVVSGFGVAPLPPVAGNDLAGVGRTNDAILYGGQVTLYVTGDDASLAGVGPKLPSVASRDYGRPFADIFKSYDHDFYKIDALLFSPAQVCLQNISTGRTHVFGAVDHHILWQSFFA